MIATDAQFVLGFSDDFFADRMADRRTVGIIIRNGQILSRETNRASGHYLPNLDMMAQYPDGRLEVYECSELTAEELLEKGAVNVFSFGPYLLRDGEINELVYTWYRDTEPRQALGMIEPGHYLLLSVQGRMKESKGAMLKGWENRVIYFSFNHETLRTLHRLDPTARTGVLYGDGLVDPVPYALGLGACALHPAVYNLQYPGFPEEARKNGMALHVWTVNTRAELLTCLEAGVSAVITNYPDKARRFYEKV